MAGLSDLASTIEFEDSFDLETCANLILEPGHGHITVTGLAVVHEAILDHLDG